MISLNVIIPVFNEQKVLPLLMDTLNRVFSKDSLSANRIENVQYLFVDDGSSDESARLIADAIREGFPATLYRLSRNFGHQAALTAGLEHAGADVVAIIDADLQDPPEHIFEMIGEWRNGYDIVYGIRRKRKENLFKVSAYWLFYRLLAWMSDVPIPKDAGDFCLMGSNVIEVFKTLPESLRFHRGMRAWVGFSHKGVTYERAARGAGTPKYSFRSLYALATDGLAWSSTKPLKLGQFASFVFSMLALLLTFITLIYYLASPDKVGDLPFWLVLTNIIMLFGFSITSLCLYILSAYVGRTYLETKSRPPYIIMEEVRTSPKTPTETSATTADSEDIK
jgi:dolichol-phosphate mannosyltransferase